MGSLLERYERFLRLDETTSISELVRARAVYIIGWATLFLQALNMISMTHSYKKWTLDHTLGLILIILIFVLIHCLRYWRHFPTYGIIFSLMISGGILASAAQGTGINSSLLPFFLFGIILNGFICGWRAVAFFCGFAVLCLLQLYFVAASNPVINVSNDHDYGIIIFQRTIQGIYAIGLTGIVTGIFSRNMHKAFGTLEQTLNRVKAADAAKTDFLGVMSHELRTPMNGIIGASEVLIKSGLTPQQHAFAEIIKGSGQNIVDIMNDALIFSQIDSGKLKITEQPIELLPFLQMVLDSHRAMANNKGLLLNLHIGHNVPKTILGDRGRLRQILSALVSNAVKFTNQGAILLVLTAKTYETGTKILFQIKDTGIGISEEDLPRIFERFVQVDMSNTRNHDGTGLGLTICEQLVNYMGGRITVESQFGKGSVFSVSLTFKSIANDLSPANLNGNSFSHTEFTDGFPQTMQAGVQTH